jgi:hypothetical protein
MALSPGELKFHEEKGIKKSDLKDGAYYKGGCRNASVARWSAEKNGFFYWRHKFGDKYVESLLCPEDAVDGWDYFQPTELIEAPEVEIPIEDNC